MDSLNENTKTQLIETINKMASFMNLECQVNLKEDAIEKNGFKVITTLDSELQEIAEESVSKYSEITKNW